MSATGWIRIARLGQWSCVLCGIWDFGAAVWRAVNARWGWAFLELVLAVLMAICWRINGWNADRLESAKIHQELFRGAS